MIELNHKGNILQCELRECGFSHGIGVTAVFYREGKPLGKIKFLCDKSDDCCSMVSGYSHEEIVARLEHALKAKVYDELLDKMYLWQSEIEKLGHNTLSPIYGNIANAF